MTTFQQFTPPNGALSVKRNGRAQAGWIVKRGIEFVAIGAAGERLGKFKTLVGDPRHP